MSSKASIITNHTTKSFAPSHHLKPLPNIPSRRRRMNELPAVSQEYVKPKVVLFYKNGDRNYRGSHVTVTPRRFRNFDNLLNELTRITKLTQGARYVFTPESGTRVQSIEELADGKSYVCGSYPKLKRINYNHGPDGRAQAKKKTNRNFIPVPPASKLNVEGSSGKLNTTIKPKIVNIIRNGVGINKSSVKILLNKRTAQSYEQVLDDITSAVGVQGGFVKKLYNRSGRVVQSLSELFGEDDIFIAVGSEKFKPSNAPKIVEESGFGKTRSHSQPLSSSKKNVHVPSAPKTSPTKKNKLHHSPHSKPAPLTTHSKLPSIQKRQEPDGEPMNNNNSELNHINLSEDDLPSTQAPQDNQDTIKKEGNSDQKVPKSFLERESTTSSKDSKEEENGSDAETDTISGIETVETKSSSSDIPNKRDEVVHVDMPDNIATESIKSSRESTMDEKEKVKKSSSVSSLRKSSVSTVSADSTDSENDENNNDKKEEHPAKEHTADSNLKNDINMLLKESEVKKTEKTFVYKERISKVFNDNLEIEELYDIGKKLGDGNFAVVKEAVDKNNNLSFALKIIDASKIEGKLAMLNNEIKIQRDSAHPNIVQLYHDMHSPTQIFLVMELISGGDFFDLISSNVSFEEDEASGYMRDLCSGLDYLHQRGIVHRDIKPENLMVYDLNGKITLKIADFGLAMKVTSPIFTICGTPTYVAPEILSEEGYGLEVDIWAAGVILYIMLCGFPPFRSPNRKQTELFDLIEKGEFEFLLPYWEDVSDSAKDLISNILVVDKESRLTAENVFKHSWLSQFGLDRNNTLASITPKRSNRFKTTAKGIQSIERMKMILKLEREQFITHVHHEDHKSVEGEENNLLHNLDEVEPSDIQEEEGSGKSIVPQEIDNVKEDNLDEVEPSDIQEEEGSVENIVPQEVDSIKENESNDNDEISEEEKHAVQNQSDRKKTTDDDSDKSDDDEDVESIISSQNDGTADNSNNNESNSKSRESTLNDMKSVEDISNDEDDTGNQEKSKDNE